MTGFDVNHPEPTLQEDLSDQAQHFANVVHRNGFGTKELNLREVWREVVKDCTVDCTVDSATAGPSRLVCGPLPQC